MKGKIIQIAACSPGQYTQLFALTDQGVIYRQSYPGWEELDTSRIKPVEQQQNGEPA